MKDHGRSGYQNLFYKGVAAKVALLILLTAGMIVAVEIRQEILYEFNPAIFRI